ncbi:transcriptional regulator [Clostridium beijerinckii]|uniref:Transcriptional regulator n=1 Tax=Clostridium beijerinckii TaxID=1520 RepID=A0A0B5QYV9_CLOBE|nr:helix-turn-helix domain-containing protein [Clostridium beijerinckii]AJH02189.1 transcriptional regulator [Clostridium beijerinckii]
MDELLTITEVSKKLKLNKTDTYSLVNKGLLKATKLGSLKVAASELDRFINWSIGKDLSNLDNPKELTS